MKFNKVIAMGLAATMLLSTAGMTTYAEETAIVEVAEDVETVNEESGSIADDSSDDISIDDVSEDKSAADDNTEDAEEADTIIDEDEEEQEPDGIQVEIEGTVEEEEEEKSALIEDTDADGKEKKDNGFDAPALFMIKSSKEMVKSTIMDVIDEIAKKFPAYSYALSALKTVIGEVFGLSGNEDSNKEILDKLEEVDKHLDRIENSLKEHMENVAAFDSIGGEFQKVTNASSPLEDKIGDINGLYKSGKINEEEKNSRLAALYNSSEYNSLMQALSGATNAYGGKTSYTLDQRSIFGAAYNLQCNSVMFSGEAVDCVAPYLIRQLCIYLRGYALINTVLDAYESVNGTEATMRTRNTMFKNLGGVVNGKVDEKNPGVFGLYSEFFNTNRYIFVNKSSNKANHVKLDKTITALLGMAEANLGNGGAIFNAEELKNRTPQVMSRFPLNAEQMKNLAAYCAAKKLTLIDFLLNNVGFELKIPYTPALSRLVTEYEVSHGVTPQTVISGSGSGTLLEYLKKGDTFVPTGAQNYTYESGQYFGYSFCEPPSYNYMQAIRANKVGAGDEKVAVASNLDKKRTGKAVNANLLFFYKAK